MSATTHVTRICRINTNWTLVERAHDAGTVSADAARNDLFERYQGAAWRYLLAATRSEAAAEELFQEFALRLIRGDFRRVERRRGRFRDYLKTVLINLVKDLHRGATRGARPLPEQLPDLSSDDVAREADFRASWRAELLDRTWSALLAANSTWHAVLRTHVRQPEATAAEKAECLSRELGEPFTANRFRVTLHRARERFSSLLRHEVATSLESPTDDQLRDELRQLRLHGYVRDAK